MPIDLSRFRMCVEGPVKINNRELTNASDIKNLYATIGNTMLGGKALDDVEYRFISEYVCEACAKSINVTKRDAPISISIIQLPGGWRMDRFYFDTPHQHISIFLPQADYDMLISKIS